MVPPPTENLETVVVIPGGLGRWGPVALLHFTLISLLTGRAQRTSSMVCLFRILGSRFVLSNDTVPLNLRRWAPVWTVVLGDWAGAGLWTTLVVLSPQILTADSPSPSSPKETRRPRPSSSLV